MYRTNRAVLDSIAKALHNIHATYKDIANQFHVSIPLVQLYADSFLIAPRFSLPVNLGIGGAVQTGYKYACNHGYDYAVQVDGDGQHDPRFLEQMLHVMQEKKLDMLIGSRFITKEGFQSSGLRRTGIKYFTWLIRLLTGKTITDPTSGLRMINKDIIQYFAKEYPRDYPEPESIVAVLKRKKKVQEIPVIMRARAGGVSSISPLNSIYYMVKVTIAILIERIR